MKPLNHFLKICLLLAVTTAGKITYAGDMLIASNCTISSTTLAAGSCFTNTLTKPDPFSWVQDPPRSASAFVKYDVAYFLVNTSTGASYPLPYCSSPNSLKGSFEADGTTGLMKVKTSEMDNPASLLVPSCIPAGTYRFEFIVSNITVSSPDSGTLIFAKGGTPILPTIPLPSGSSYTIVQESSITITNGLNVFGTGTNNFLSKWNNGTCNSVLTNSQVYDNGTNVGIGTTSPNTKFEVSGVARLTTNTSSHLQLGALNSGDNFAYISSASQTNGTGLKFATTNGSGTNTAAVQMTMLNNGNIGIGTNSPNFKLQLANGSIFVPSVTGSGGNIYLGGETNAGNTGMRLWGDASGLAGGGIDVKSSIGFIIRMDNSIGSTERFRIHATTGNVGLNVSNPLSSLHVRGSSPSNTELFLEPSVWDGTGVQYATIKFGDNNHLIRAQHSFGMSFYDMNKFCFQNAPVVIAGIGNTDCEGEEGYALTVRGDIFEGSSFIASDKRYKKNIQPIENAFDKLSKINGYTYEMETEKFDYMKFDKARHSGVIAQELKEVLPEAVRQGKNGYYAVNYDAIIPLLIEAMKEQHKEVSDKDEVISQLKSEVSALESRLQKLEQALAGNNSGASEKGNLLLKDVPVLEQNTPNPFSTSTTVKYFVPNMKSSAEIDVYDSKGIKINSYAIKVAGSGEITIKTQDLAPGNYFYELVIDGQKIASRKMIFVH